LPSTKESNIFKRDGYIDYLKGALILLVCIGHSFQFNIYTDLSYFWESPLYKLIYMFHMPLFMCVSGYLSFKGLQNNFYLAKVFINQLNRLILPVLVWTGSTTIFFSIMKGRTVDIIDVLNAFTGQLWYLWALAISVIYLAVSIKLKKEYWLFIPSISTFNL
jgi:fucose 4-O-acetylase-like acetyltransferase